MCHGQDAQEAGLDLRTKAAMLKGKAFVSGKPNESAMIKRIISRECPPDKNISMAGIERMEGSEVKILRDWIAAGAPEVKQTIEPQEIDPKDREHWSFQPPQRPKVPQVANPSAVRNAIDAFLLRKLEAQKIGFSAATDKHTLIRRVTFDLTGLPPTRKEMENFLKDKSPTAFETVVDRLLASPAYGVRWGRHWLDLAGYSDSEGKRNADMIRDYAWKYRDYVIKAFNDDKPYDEFLIEQIAGDELVDYSDPEAIDENVIEKLVATGFLRMAPDGTSANPVNRVQDRLEVIGDELQILAGGVLGLTLKCARCHDHKYDPISQRDYYSFAAIFKASYDEYNWLTPQPFKNQWAGSTRRHLEVMLPKERRAVETRNARIDEELKPLEEKFKAVKGKERKELKTKIDELKAKKKSMPLIRALWDRGESSPTYVNLRGNPGNPGPLVEPAVPRVLSEKSFQPAKVVGRNKTGNRLALARWITQPDHPLTSRVWVNRVWKHHYGRGIVASLDNFGKLGSAPTHPELLDWLAIELVENKWSTKHLHRLICTSTAYRQSSLKTKTATTKDPDNVWLSRMRMRRLDAEELHDGLLAISGRLNLRLGGKPDDVQVRERGYVTGKPGEGGWRRSVYIRQRRIHMMTMLETFDLPAMNPNCVARINSTVVQQPLFLLHDKVIYNLSRKLASEIQKEAKGIEPAIRLAYRKIVNRPPSERELVGMT
ncbi:MAG: PSD1 and planctomycete cytochrome C domain-containing protein, partial [Pedosphaera sp.]|nr:PSD1 and planctomycete cytochrome C domain-containing protein [Pedosphaera sp.]